MCIIENVENTEKHQKVNKMICNAPDSFFLLMFGYFFNLASHNIKLFFLLFSLYVMRINPSIKM